MSETKRISDDQSSDTKMSTKQGGTAAKLYNVFLLLVDLLVLLVRFVNEIFLSTIRLFIGDGLKDVSGEVILITGTGHGIGKELAKQYADMECKIICIDINEKTNNETVNEINAIKKGQAFGYICDITNRDSTLELANKIRAEVGHVSVIINNAGIMPCHPLDKTTDKEIRKLFDVNVLSHFWVLEAFLPHLKEKGRGHVIAMSSMAGMIGLSNLVPYCATKFAVRGLMEALSEEIREDSTQYDIKFTTIFPNMVDTGLCKNPKSRFPSIFGLLSSKQVASSIINAHRRNLRETCLPRYLYYINNIMRILPDKCGFALKDFLDTGLESDL